MRTFIKIVLAVVLLFVLALVSYIKTEDSAAREKEELYRKGYLHFKRQDSLHLEMLDDTAGFYLDSLRNLDAYYLNVIDSLNNVFADREATYLEKQRKLEAENKRSAEKSKARDQKASKKTEKTDSTRSKVRKEYKRMLNGLPSDLTSYEKRVATNEIIVVLSEKYKLAPDAIRGYIK